MTEFRDTNGNNVYVKDFGTDKLPVGTIIISNRTGCYLQLSKVAGRVTPVQIPIHKGKAKRHKNLGNAKLH